MSEKLILLTGASRGIGQAILHKLCQSKAGIIVATATGETGQKAIQEILDQHKTPGTALLWNALSQDSHIQLLETVKATFDRMPDVLINNAGITRDNLLLRMKPGEWNDVIQANLTAIFHLSQACTKGMIRKRWGRIINISSVVARIGNAGQANYAAAKAAVAGKKEFKFGGETHPVKMSKSKAEKILSEMEKEISESDKKHPKQYGAPQGSQRDKELDQTQADLKHAEELRKDGKTAQAEELEQRAYNRREKMEKRARKEESLNTLSRDEMIEIIQEVIAEVELDEMLSEIDERLDEKLSAKTKATLKKKAEKRGLTPGSVYREFKKGLAAWASSGSRKGMSQHQWAYARVNSATPSKSWAVVKKAKKKKKSKKKK